MVCLGTIAIPASFYGGSDINLLGNSDPQTALLAGIAWRLERGPLLARIASAIITMPQYLYGQGYTTQGIGKIYDPRCLDSNLDSLSWSVPYYRSSREYFSKSTGAPEMDYQLPETKELIRKYRAEGERKGLKGRELTDYIQKLIRPSVECADVPDNAYSDGANTLDAKDILARLSKEGKPFFFAVGFSKPHLPFVAPKKYWDLYRRDEMPLAPFQQASKNGPELAYHRASELYA